ncbi:MAG: 3'(2'),5'-bisphosphate nucleotidase CysQ, partial [Cyclobacteriaceae bacterium]
MKPETLNLKPETLNLNQLLELGISAAEEASKEILSVYHSENFETELKGDNSPLTVADKRAHLCIVKHLEKTGLPILSEEGKDIPYEERKNWKRFWMVDPLDGTKEFIKRNDEFTVNIALIENGVPILGVLAVPVTGVVYYAAKGVGAFKLKSSMFKVQSSEHSQPETLKPETLNLKLKTLKPETLN